MEQPYTKYRTDHAADAIHSCCFAWRNATQVTRLVYLDQITTDGDPVGSNAPKVDSDDPPQS